MNHVFRSFVVALLSLASAQLTWAQTAEDVIDRALTASGGRAALAKVKSRSTVGTITLMTPAGNASGSVELLNAAPNKIRSLIQIDLSAFGAGPFVLDARFNGTSGYILDSLQGNREISGNQLDNFRNGAFPHGYLTYKALGITAQLIGKEKVGDRDAFVLSFEPTAGSIDRQYLDAETFLLLKSVIRIDVPQLGREIEQTTEFSDFRDVDGIRLPFRMAASSAVQNYTIAVTKVEHNVPVDEALFSKPVSQ